MMITINKDEIIRMAREGIQSYLSNGGLFNPEEMNHDKVRELIMLCRDALDLAAAHEREACARVCEELDNHFDYTIAARQCAAAIRARGKE